MSKRVIVIGGGVAGMRCALTLSSLGCVPMIVEKSTRLGGRLNNCSELIGSSYSSELLVQQLSSEISKRDIRVELSVQITDISRGEGGSLDLVAVDGNSYEAEAVILATGLSMVDPKMFPEYGYGHLRGVVTSLELERMLLDDDVSIEKLKIPEKVLFVHCVGSRSELVGVKRCSKMCCSVALRQAIALKKILGEKSRIFQLFRDMTLLYDKSEQLYSEAQKLGVEIIRGGVSEIRSLDNGALEVWAEDMVLQRTLKVSVDMVVLMCGMRGSITLPVVRGDLKAERDSEGFLNRQQSEGQIFAVGSSTSVKGIEEILSDADSVALQVGRTIL